MMINDQLSISWHFFFTFLVHSLENLQYIFILNTINPYINIIMLMFTSLIIKDCSTTARLNWAEHILYNIKHHYKKLQQINKTERNTSPEPITW